MLKPGVVFFSIAIIALPSLADDPRFFTTPDEAAIFYLSEYNVESIRDNMELGGYLYRTVDNRITSSRILRGDHGSLRFPPPANLLPDHATLIATWHTHGAAMAGVVSETFSPQDIDLNIKHGIDGYLATPSGQLKHYRLNNPEIRRIGQLP